MGRNVGFGRIHIVTRSNDRLKVVPVRGTLTITGGTSLSLIYVSPGTRPPIYGVVSCNGCYFRRTGHRGRGHGGRGIVRAGRVHLNLDVSIRSFRAGNGRTVGFLRDNGGIGISVHFHNHRVKRPRVNLRAVRHFTRFYGSATGIRGPTGLRKHGVLVFLTPGSNGWRAGRGVRRLRYLGLGRAITREGTLDLPGPIGWGIRVLLDRAFLAEGPRGMERVFTELLSLVWPAPRPLEDWFLADGVREWVKKGDG